MISTVLRTCLGGLALALLIIGCSGASLTLAVPTVTVPAGTTVGTVCYAKSEAATSVQVRRATYRAEATYHSHGSLLETAREVEVRVLGRSSPPASPCVAEGPDDLVLGGPFTLTVDEPQWVVVGEGDAAEVLAGLVNGGDFWLGVSLTSGFALGGERTVTFDRGRVTVGF